MGLNFNSFYKKRSLQSVFFIFTKTFLVQASRLLFLVIFWAVLHSACKKETVTPTPNDTSTIPNLIPPFFKKNIIIENFKGEWNPNCPTGDDSLQKMYLLDTHKIICVNIHQGDWLAIPSFFMQINSYLGGINGYPRATINRQTAQYGSQIDSVLLSIVNWRVNIMPYLIQTSNVGMALESKIRNDSLFVNLYYASSDTNVQNCKLTLYLIEHNITAQNQQSAPTSPYVHHHVLRQVLSQYLGDNVVIENKKKLKSYSLSLNGTNYKKADLQLVALIHSEGADYKNHRVLNCIKANVSQTKNWNE